MEQTWVVNGDLLGLSLPVEIRGASNENNSHRKDAVADVGAVVSLGGSSTLGGVEDHLRFDFFNIEVVHLFVGGLCDVNDVVVFLGEPILELADVLSRLSIDMRLELSHEIVDFSLELLLVLDLLRAEVQGHVIKDTLDVVGSLTDLLLTQLHGLLVMLLRELFP